jgi:integrase
VSLAVKAGAHTIEIQARAGHASIVITMDVYADLFDGEDERLAERLAELWWSHGGLEPAEDAFKLEQQRKKRGSD